MNIRALALLILLAVCLGGCAPGAVPRNDYSPDLSVANVIPRHIALEHLQSVSFDIDEQGAVLECIVYGGFFSLLTDPRRVSLSCIQQIVTREDGYKVYLKTSGGRYCPPREGIGTCYKYSRAMMGSEEARKTVEALQSLGVEIAE